MTDLQPDRPWLDTSEERRGGHPFSATLLAAVLRPPAAEPPVENQAEVDEGEES